MDERDNTLTPPEGGLQEPEREAPIPAFAELPQKQDDGQAEPAPQGQGEAAGEEPAPGQAEPPSEADDLAEPPSEADGLDEDDFDSRYIWDAYNKVLYEALPEKARKQRGFPFWLGLGACGALLALCVAGWLQGGKLLLPAFHAQSHSILGAAGAAPQTPPPVTAAPTQGGADEEQPQAEAGAAFVPTAILVDGEAEGVLASREAAYALVEDVKAHFSALAREKGEGELSVELVEEVTFRPAEEGEAVESYEALFSRFTGGRGPLKVRCTLTTKESKAVDFDTTEEKDKYLLEGTSIVVSGGRPGAELTITYAVYDNGNKRTTLSKTETQTIKPQDRVVRVGTQEVDPKAEPGKKEGRQGPDTELSFQSPLPGGEIISNYGQRQGVLHLGLDYAPKEGGGLEVVASCGGVVAAVMERGGYGLLVELDHGSGFTTRYAHLASASVALGDTVTAGQAIGQAGQSGNAGEVHLHFELRAQGEAYNPRYYLD